MSFCLFSVCFLSSECILHGSCLEWQLVELSTCFHSLPLLTLPPSFRVTDSLTFGACLVLVAILPVYCVTFCDVITTTFSLHNISPLSREWSGFHTRVCFGFHIMIYCFQYVGNFVRMTGQVHTSRNSSPPLLPRRS